MGLALRNLLPEKTRFALSVAGVGLAAMLILLLNGFQAGLYRQLGAYLDNSPGSVVVAQRGVTGFIGGVSPLTPGTVALVSDPALILADGPTANLDSKIGHDIMRLLRRIAKEQGRSVVIVAHDQRIRDIAYRVLWLEDGEFKETVTMATDPVCGMSVDRAAAVARLEWGGELLHFCSRGCLYEFLAQRNVLAPV